MKKILGLALCITMIALTPAVGNESGKIIATCGDKTKSLNFSIDPIEGIQDLNDKFKNVLVSFEGSEKIIMNIGKNEGTAHILTDSGAFLIDGKKVATCSFKNLDLLRQKKKNEVRELQARAKQGDADAQYSLGNAYNKGKGVPQDFKTAGKWFRLAAEQGHADAQKRYKELILQDFVYGSDIRKLKNLVKSVETLCKRNIKCAFDKVWAYLDISGDRRLSLSEIARFQRNVVKFAAVHQNQNVPKTEEIAAINLASIIFLPITASSVLHSFDYNNDELLSKNEVFGDTEFSKLVGVDVETFATGLDFQSLGKKLQDAMKQIPFLK